MSNYSSTDSELTARQRQVLEYFYRYLLQHGAQPGFEEIMVAMGGSSKNGVKNHFAALIKKGWLAPAARQGKARAMKILRQPNGAPFYGLRFVKDGPLREDADPI